MRLQLPAAKSRIVEAPDGLFGKKFPSWARRGSVSSADPPGGADRHGRSHNEQVWCVWGGVAEASVVASVRGLVCFGGGLPGSAYTDVSNRFTRQDHLVDISDQLKR